MQPGVPKVRDDRIDIVRGLAMICIYIDHAPGNAAAAVTLKAFGFSDASEVFVLISGMSAGLAYGALFLRNRDCAVRRILHRIATIYTVQLTIAAASIGVLLAAAYWLGNPHYREHATLAMLPKDLFSAIAGLATLYLQPGYLHILPVYIVLLLALPAILKLAAIRPLLPFAISMALWLLAQRGMNLPAMGEPRGWYFDPFAWQLLFVVGVVCASPHGRARDLLHPVSAGVAMVFLVFALLVAAPWQIVPALADWHVFDPGLVTRSDKHTLGTWRLLHILALAYTAAYFVPRTASWLRAKGPVMIATIGRNGLLSFSIATILDEWLLVWRLQGGRGVMYQLTINAGGILVLWACAKGAEAWQASRCSRGRGDMAGMVSRV